jgi:hypothetical protein
LNGAQFLTLYSYTQIGDKTGNTGSNWGPNYMDNSHKLLLDASLCDFLFLISGVKELATTFAMNSKSGNGRLFELNELTCVSQLVCDLLAVINPAL